MKILQLDKTDKVLIVAPHPDDESIGCGGLITKFYDQVDVLLVSDGSRGAYLGETKEEIIKKRKDEFQTALKIAAVSNSFFLDIPDREIKKNFKIIKKFNIKKYSMIFVPNKREKHIDHCCLYRMFLKMIKLQKSSARLFEYEVWSPISDPNFYLEITDVMPKKIEMVGSYKSQLICYDYIKLAESLNSYRGAFSKVQYAEAYYLETKVDFFKNLILKIKNKLKK